MTDQFDIIDIDDLNLDPKNARRHGDRNRQSIKESLRATGPARSIVITDDDTVLAGNGVTEVAREMGIRRVIVVDGDRSTLVAVRRNDLTEEEKVSLALYDNRSGELAEWDATALAQIQQDDPSLIEKLFEKKEWTRLMAQLDKKTDGLEGEGVQTTEIEPDRADELQEKWQAQLGDVWVTPSKSTPTGVHIVFCGDSTKPESLDKLGLSSGGAHLVWTDPPWNVAYGENLGGNPMGYSNRKIQNDNLGDKFPQFIADFCAVIRLASLPGALIYMAMSAQEWPNIDAGLRAAGFHWSSTIIWMKDHPVLSRKDYNTQFEPLWYGWRDDAPRLAEVEDHTQSDVWQIDRPTRSPEHPTMKPVALVARALINSSRKGNIVFDPFLGSGTVMVAAEQTGRLGRGIELEPKYISVTLERLSLLGLEPRLAERDGTPVEETELADVED